MKKNIYIYIVKIYTRTYEEMYEKYYNIKYTMCVCIYMLFFCFGKSEYEKEIIDCPFSDRTKKETPVVFLETKKSSHDKKANIGDDYDVCACVCDFA